MVARQASTVVIATAQDLDQLRETLDQFSGEQIILDLNPDSDPVLSTAGDFRRLAASAVAAGVSLTISTDDPVRQELARFSGLEVDGGWRNVTTASRFAADEVTVVREPDAEPESDGSEGDDAVDAEEPVETTGPAIGPQLERIDPFDTNASFGFMINPPVPRRPDIATSPAQDSRAFTTVRPVVRQGAKRRATPLIIFAVIALIAIIAALLIGVIAPFAKVKLVPATQPVSASVTYGLAGAGDNFDVTIDPAVIRTSVSHETTIPTTGERFEPDAAASGSITFTNPATQDVVVPAGTQLTIPDSGISFVTSFDVTVPAADPFGSGTFGTAAVEAIAEQAGTDANIATGGLTGQLESGVFYTNRGDMTGGTVKSIAVASDADIAKAQAEAETALTEQADGAIQGEIPDGYTMLDGSTSTGELQVELDHAAGEDAETLAVNATMVVEAQVYDPEALHQAGSDALDQRLDESVPAGFEVQPESLQASEPQAVDGAAGPAYVVSGTSEAQAIITREQLDRLNADLVGADEDAARRAISSIPGLESYNVQFGPDWLPFAAAPRLESRIEVDVEQEVEQTSAGAGETGP